MLTLIIGCMYSGKSTEVLRQIRLARSLHHAVFSISFAGDTRYGEAGSVRTHDGDSETCCVAVSRLLPLLNNSQLRAAKLVVVDEAHFFPDLHMFVLGCVDELGKAICVAGLDADSKAEPFENIMSLLPFADEVLRLRGMCRACGDGTPATLSLRLSDTHGERLLVGGQDTYMPVCRRHFLSDEPPNPQQ